MARHISNIVNNVEISVGYFTGEDLPRYNSRSLLQHALCSRYLHRVVEPVLYDRFHYRPKTSAKGFQLFLTRILARPDLGKWAKVFHVDDTEASNLGMLSGGLLDYEEYYHYYYKTRFDVRQFTPEEMKAIQKKIAETGMTDAEFHWWALGAERMDLNAMIALVLTLTPNLEVLDINMWTRPVGSQQLTPMLDLNRATTKGETAWTPPRTMGPKKSSCKVLLRRKHGGQSWCRRDRLWSRYYP